MRKRITNIYREYEICLGKCLKVLAVNTPKLTIAVRMDFFRPIMSIASGLGSRVRNIS